MSTSGLSGDGLLHFQTCQALEGLQHEVELAVAGDDAIRNKAVMSHCLGRHCALETSRLHHTKSLTCAGGGLEIRVNGAAHHTGTLTFEDWHGQETDLSREAANPLGRTVRPKALVAEFFPWLRMQDHVRCAKLPALAMQDAPLLSMSSV